MRVLNIEALMLNSEKSPLRATQIPSNNRPSFVFSFISAFPSARLAPYDECRRGSCPDYIS